ncbi:MAG: DUF2252 domain-containing protein [Candidatus Nanopelagicales bacterium]
MPSKSSGRAQQWDAGKAARSRLPRSALGEWVSAADRRDPVAVLTQFDSSRSQRLLPVRNQRMAASAFGFFRGAAAIMAADLGTRENTALNVQLAGNAHLANFGGFATADRQLVFDLSDFDETLPGPFEFDVCRLAASFDVAARDRGFPVKAQNDLVALVAGTYRQAMADFSTMSRMDLWFARITASDILDTWAASAGADGLRASAFRKVLATGRAKTGAQAVSRYTRTGRSGELELVSAPPLVTPLRELRADLDKAAVSSLLADVFAGYQASLSDDRRAIIAGYRPVDAAQKVVGVGSVGTRCWIVLLVAKDNDADDLVLQYKQANPAVLESALRPSSYGHPGRRIVEGQRLMQTGADALLGWTRVRHPDGREVEYYVRQMWDWKTTPNVDSLALPIMRVYAKICGWTLARAHARSGSPAALSAYLGSGAAFERAMIQFAAAYADQNAADYKAFLSAIKKGELPVADGDAGGALDIG